MQQVRRRFSLCVITPPLAAVLAEWLGKAQCGSGGGGQGGRPLQWLRQRKPHPNKMAGRGTGGKWAQDTCCQWLDKTLNRAEWGGCGRDVDPDASSPGLCCLRQGRWEEEGRGSQAFLLGYVFLSCSAPTVLKPSGLCQGLSAAVRTVPGQGRPAALAGWA